MVVTNKYFLRKNKKTRLSPLYFLNKIEKERRKYVLNTKI
jgi:hypothetical protein